MCGRLCFLVLDRICLCCSPRSTATLSTTGRWWWADHPLAGSHAVFLGVYLPLLPPPPASFALPDFFVASLLFFSPRVLLSFNLSGNFAPCTALFLSAHSPPVSPPSRPQQHTTSCCVRFPVPPVYFFVCGDTVLCEPALPFATLAMMLACFLSASRRMKGVLFSVFLPFFPSSFRLVLEKNHSTRHTRPENTQNASSSCATCGEG